MVNTDCSVCDTLVHTKSHNAWVRPKVCCLLWWICLARASWACCISGEIVEMRHNCPRERQLGLVSKFRKLQVCGKMWQAKLHLQHIHIVNTEGCGHCPPEGSYTLCTTPLSQVCLQPNPVTFHLRVHLTPQGSSESPSSWVLVLFPSLFTVYDLSALITHCTAEQLFAVTHA